MSGPLTEAFGQPAWVAEAVALVREHYDTPEWLKRKHPQARFGNANWRLREAEKLADRNGFQMSVRPAARVCQLVRKVSSDKAALDAFRSAEPDEAEVAMTADPRYPNVPAFIPTRPDEDEEEELEQARKEGRR